MLSLGFSDFDAKGLKNEQCGVPVVETSEREVLVRFTAGSCLPINAVGELSA